MLSLSLGEAMPVISKSIFSAVAESTKKTDNKPKEKNKCHVKFTCIAKCFFVVYNMPELI